MSFRLLPKDVRFFDLFVADGENLQVAATKLREMIDSYDRLDERRSRPSRSAVTTSIGRSTSGSRMPSSRRSTGRTSTI
jgi:hypothetical protein